MSTFLEVNQRIELGGDVTQLVGLIGKTASHLEEAIGYEPGRLRDGWNLLFLTEDINIGDLVRQRFDSFRADPFPAGSRMRASGCRR